MTARKQFAKIYTQNDIFDLLAAKLKFVTDGLKGIASVADEVGDAINFGPISGVMNLLGGR